MSESTLFDQTPPGARTSDPETSRAADRSARIRKGSQIAKLTEVYARPECASGLTDDAAASLAALPVRSCWWKRCSDMRAMGIIADTGRTSLGMMNEYRMVCAITEKGRQLLAAALLT